MEGQFEFAFPKLNAGPRKLSSTYSRSSWGLASMQTQPREMFCITDSVSARSFPIPQNGPTISLSSETWQICFGRSDENLFLYLELAGFRNQMLNVIADFSKSPQNGLFINSCFAHCQSEKQDTWFSNNSPVIGNKVSTRSYSWSKELIFTSMTRNVLILIGGNGDDLQAIATAVGDWYFDRAAVKAIDCPYPCDKSCHHLVFQE